MANNYPILSLDSSHLRGSVALTGEDGLLSGVFFDASDTHSATLLPAVDTALKMAGLELKQIGSFAVVIGPGSFTGLRIGLSTIKGFASVRKRPVYTVSSLELLAAAFPYSAFPVASVLDARRNEVYFGLYGTGSGIPHEISPPAAVSPETLPELIRERAGTGKVIACGTGAARYADIIVSGEILSGRKAAMFPDASLMPEIAENSEPVDFDSLAGLEPLYIRVPDARPSVKLRDKKG
jgi:tRNA threonylcarbamoyladenosine biosynthesis protein TsaB